MSKFSFLGVLVVLLLGGCMSTKEPANTAELRMAADEGIVVIGLSPGARLTFSSGKIKDGKFYADLDFPVGLEGESGDGFMVRKLKVLPKGRAYGLTDVYMNTSFAPKCGVSVPTFVVRPQEVQYIKSFHVKQRFNSIDIDSRDDVSGASKYLKEKYPGSGFDVISGAVSDAVLERCRGVGVGIPIPIYVPISR